MSSATRVWTHDPGASLRPVSIGAVTVVPVVQLHYRADPFVFFRGLDRDTIDPSAWYWQPPYLDEGLMVIDIGGFLVRTPDRTILVDAGMGNGKTRPNPAMSHRDDDWFTTLRRAGASPEDIDTVVFTHLHGDHVGYATRQEKEEWVPTFEHARCLVSAAEYAYWCSEDARRDLTRLGDYMSDSVEPLRRAGVLDLVAPDVEISDEVRLVPASGHTPGNVCVEISSGGQRGVFAGDMVHHAVQLAFPDLNTDFCVDGTHAAGARRALLADLADTDAVFFPAHFPDAVPGTVVSDRDGGYRYLPLEEEAA